MTQADPPRAPQPGDAPNPSDFAEPPVAPAPQPVAAAAPAPAPAPARPQAPQPGRMARVTVDDKVEYLSGRRIRITVNGQRFNLRAPTHDEYKRFRDAWNQLAADGRDIRSKGEIPDQTQDVYEIVLQAIGTFADEPWDIAPEAEPPWLENANLVAGMLSHWAEVPGSPT